MPGAGWKGQLIEQVCDEVISGKLDADFPLYVWQTGSGTHTVASTKTIPAPQQLRDARGTAGS